MWERWSTWVTKHYVNLLFLVSTIKLEDLVYMGQDWVIHSTDSSRYSGEEVTSETKQELELWCDHIDPPYVVTFWHISCCMFIHKKNLNGVFSQSPAMTHMYEIHVQYTFVMCPCLTQCSVRAYMDASRAKIIIQVSHCILLVECGMGHSGEWTRQKTRCPIAS